MQTNQLLVAIQELTVEEFCLQYCGSTQVYLNQQNRKRMNQDSLGKFRKRKSVPDTTAESTLKKTKPSHGKETIQEGRNSASDTIFKKSMPVQEKEVTKHTEETIQEEKEEKEEMEKEKEEVEEIEEEKEEVEEKENKKEEERKQMQVPEQDDDIPEENIEPFIVQLKRNGRSCINIQLEPGEDIEESGHFDIEALDMDVISKLSSTHKSRLCKQIQDIQDQLDILKHKFK
ncbi:hypothetical protein K501DRAFT_332862 [Backusella circina FSU 941]|nr:hypothetical protein K501DRAFT_332862 [Backusella circina FSU 941]